MKFVGAPGDDKSVTLRNIMSFWKNHDNIDKNLYEEMSKLNISLINQNTGISDLHPDKSSEIFTHLDLTMTKAYEDVVEMMKDNNHLQFDVIIEGQPIEEIILYALTYRATEKLTDFSINLLLKKYHCIRDDLWKLQKNIALVYLLEDGSDSIFKLTKRRQILEVYDSTFVHTYICMMTSNFINKEDTIIIRMSLIGETKTLTILMETISAIIKEDDEEPEDSPLSPEPAPPLEETTPPVSRAW